MKSEHPPTPPRSLQFSSPSAAQQTDNKREPETEGESNNGNLTTRYNLVKCWSFNKWLLKLK